MSLATRAWRLIAVVVTLAAVAFISVVPQVANDFWLQAKVGELIVHEHAIPATVLFPFTEIRNAPFNAHEWLSSVFFFGLLNAVGEAGLPLTLGVSGLVLFALMAWLAYRRSEGNLPLALLLGLVAVGAENFRHSMRPELISLIILGVYWHLLEACRHRLSPAALFGALLMVVLWSNTHGSFILAPIIACLYAGGVWLDGYRDPERFTSATSAKTFALFAVAAWCCTLINPFDWGLLKFVVEFGNSTFINQNVVEWYSIFDARLQGQRGLWIGWMCACTVTTTALVRWKKLSAVDALMLLLFLALALRAIRFVVYLGMVCAYVLPALAPASWKRFEIQTRLYAICALFSATVLGMAMVFGNAMGGYPHRVDWSPAFTQSMLIALADPKLQGNVLNDYDYGSELVYRTYPRLRPSIDSRIDSFGSEYFFYHRRLVHEEHLFIDFVAKYDVRFLLMDHSNFQDFQRLPSYTNKHWIIHAMDQKAVLLRRSDP